MLHLGQRDENIPTELYYILPLLRQISPREKSFWFFPADHIVLSGFHHSGLATAFVLSSLVLNEKYYVVSVLQRPVLDELYKVKLVEEVRDVIHLPLFSEISLMCPA